MTLLDKTFPQYRLTLAMTAILTLVGIMAIFSIPKEEDPDLRNRNGYIKVVFPGAEPQKLEDWVVTPLEARLLSVSGIKDVEVKIRPDVAIIQIELKTSIKDTEKIWNEVERELDKATPDFPSAVSEVELNRDVMELEAVLLSVENENPVHLAEDARTIERFVERLPGVKKIEVHGDPDIGIDVQVSSEKLARRGLTMPMLLEQIRQKNLSLPAGTFSGKEGLTQLRTKNSLDKKEDVAGIPILFRDLRTHPLQDFATVSYAPAQVPTSIVRMDGKRSMVLGIVPETPVDILDWGDMIKEKVSELKKTLPRSGMTVVAFQPERSRERIRDLTVSLLAGMASVIVILGFWMGWRTGLVVAISVPVISLIGFGLYFVGGGILHQISMAALLLSLGQFIDNVTVIAENTQRLIDEGTDSVSAAGITAEKFRRPMIFATGTAIAAFLPLLASEGPTAEFTSSIPLIAVVTLLVSYFFALQTTPVLCGLLLRKKGKSERDSRGVQLIDRLSGKTVTVFTLSLLVFLLSGLSFLFIPKQFFPGADRNEFSLTLLLPEASSIFQTDLASTKVELWLRKHPEVKRVTTFVGQSTPHYYYSLIGEDRVPNRADFLIATSSAESNLRIIRDLEESFKDQKDFLLIPKILGQGPPVNAAIELEIFSTNYDELVKRIGTFVKAQNIEGAKSLRSTAPGKLPVLEFVFSEDTGAERGLDRNQLALNLLSSSQGVTLTSYFENGEKLPIRITQESKSKFPDNLSEIVAVSTLYRDFPLSSFTKQKTEESWSLIERKNGRRYVRVYSDLAPGSGLGSVGSRLKEKLFKALAGLTPEINEAGQAGESATANLSILRALPFGFMLLIGCLLYEFRSYRKLLIVLGSVAIVSTGAFPGLLIGGQPFGFTALLGILALTGIVVNNCILIIEAIDEERENGKSTSEAIGHALKLRTRPVILTTIMTLAGLLPLALENSTLWPPMAWAMMSGLVVSTFWSLITLPEIYRRLFALIPFLFLSTVHARTFTLKDLASSIDDSEAAKAAREKIDGSEAQKDSASRKAYAPKLGASLTRTMNDRELFLNSAMGPVPYGKTSYNYGGIELRQPVVSLSSSLGLVRAREVELEATKLLAEGSIERAKLDVLTSALTLQEVIEVRKLFEELEANLRVQRKETERLLPQGRSDPSDLIKVDVELSQTLRKLADLEVTAKDLKNRIRVFVPEFEELTTQEVKNLLSTPDGQSPGLWETRAKEKSLEATGASAKALTLSYLPEVDVVGRYQGTEQGFLIDETKWYSLSVELRWNFFDGGVNLAEKRAQLAKLRGETHGLVQFRRQVTADLLNLKELEKKDEGDLLAWQANATGLQKVLAKERNFYRSGKVDLNRVLDTERLLIEQRRNLVQSLYRRTRLRLERHYLEGKSFDGKIFD